MFENINKGRANSKTLGMEKPNNSLVGIVSLIDRRIYEELHPMIKTDNSSH